MKPQDYPTRILVAVTGLSPQIVTETLYALAVVLERSQRPFVPTKIRLITTEEGARRAQDSLLNPGNGWFHRLRSDYRLPAIEFGPQHIVVLKDGTGKPLDDIRTRDDNERAADAITDEIRQLTRDDDTALHVSIAGGRKTMGFYLGYAYLIATLEKIPGTRRRPFGLRLSPRAIRIRSTKSATTDTYAAARHVAACVRR